MCCGVRVGVSSSGLLPGSLRVVTSVSVGYSKCGDLFGVVGLRKERHSCRGLSVVIAAMAPGADQTPTFGVSLYPLHRSKIIHIVRHGQGYHNVAGELDHKNYMSWEYQDASLTDLGWKQAEALHEHVVMTNLKAQVELVVVSPLLRTLQTASGVWGGGALVNGESEESALMVSGLGKSTHAAITAVGTPKFVANEWCREQNGVHPCDRRSSVSFYKARFPNVDFSEVQTDDDTWWSPTKRENSEDLFSRARVFVRWLLDRPETRITVVSHSSFIFHMCHLFGEDCSDIVRKEIQQGFRNCEMRSVVISDRLATGPPTSMSTDFAGGLNYNMQGKMDMDVPHRQIFVEDKAVPHADSLHTVSQKADLNLTDKGDDTESGKLSNGI